MFLRNFYNYCIARMLGTGGTDYTTFGKGHISLKAIDGVKYSFNALKTANSSQGSNGPDTQYYSSAAPCVQPIFTSAVILNQSGTQLAGQQYVGSPGSNTGYGNHVLPGFGTGTESVTFDDYKLTPPLVSLAYSGLYYDYVPEFNEETGEWSAKCKFELKNNGTESVTLTEFGLFGFSGLYYSLRNETSPSGVSNNVLIYRELLDDPIVLEPNQAITYTHVSKFKFPEPEE